MEGMDVMGVYVVQVIGGQEESASEMIIKHAQDIVEDCFIPRHEFMYRKSGHWHCKLRKLFPGYVFVATDEPERVRAAIRRMPAFSRMLTTAAMHAYPFLLNASSSDDSVTHTETHVMGMREGIIEGDRVMVTRGRSGCKGQYHQDRPTQAAGMGGYGHVWT